MMVFMVLMQTVRIGSPVLGVIIPAIIFVISFIATWMLYRHFSRH